MASFDLSALVELVVDGLGSFQITPAKVSSTTPKYSDTRIELASGANTITVPTGASYVLIIPDSTSGTTKKIKGIAGDTGITLGIATMFALIPIANATFVIDSSAADTGKFTHIVFF